MQRTGRLAKNKNSQSVQKVEKHNWYMIVEDVIAIKFILGKTGGFDFLHATYLPVCIHTLCSRGRLLVHQGLESIENAIP